MGMTSRKYLIERKDTDKKLKFYSPLTNSPSPNYYNKPITFIESKPGLKTPRDKINSIWFEHKKI